MTEYFGTMLRDKSVHKRILSSLHLNYDYKDYNFETREKQFRLREQIIAPSIELFFEQNISRSAKEKAIHFLASSTDAAQPTENGFELPDGEKVIFESSFNFDRNFFDKKENNPQSVELQSLVAESLAACDLDIRKNILAGIVLAGGNSLIPKFKESFEEILNNFLVGNAKAKLVCPARASDRKLSAWVGGSVLASTGAFQNMWVSKGEYEESGESVIQRKCLN